MVRSVLQKGVKTAQVHSLFRDKCICKIPNFDGLWLNPAAIKLKFGNLGISWIIVREKRSTARPACIALHWADLVCNFLSRFWNQGVCEKTIN